MAPVTRSSFYAILFICLPFVFSTDIRVNGPDLVIAGNYEKFTCDMEGDSVSSNYGYEWKFKLKNGDLVGMNDSDVLTALEVQSYTPKHLTVTSFLRAETADVISVGCWHSSKNATFKDIEVKDLPIITTDDDPCARAEETGKPITSVFMPSPNILLPAYRRSHYINDQYLQLSYGTDVAEIKLVCYSPSNDKSPVWSFNKDIASKLRFAAWAQQPAGQCNRQILHIYQVAGEAGELVNLKLDCSTGDLTSKVNLGLEFPISRAGGGMDMNSTANCINEIVDSFYNKELTGVSIGGSFAIIMMMVGIAVLKKQLEQQKNINRDLQAKNQGGNTANGGSSTEHLNSNHNNHNGSNYA